MTSMIDKGCINNILQENLCISVTRIMEKIYGLYCMVPKNSVRGKSTLIEHLKERYDFWDNSFNYLNNFIPGWEILSHMFSNISFRVQATEDNDCIFDELMIRLFAILLVDSSSLNLPYTFSKRQFSDDIDFYDGVAMLQFPFLK